MLRMVPLPRCAGKDWCGSRGFKAEAAGEGGGKAVGAGVLLDAQARGPGAGRAGALDEVEGGKRAQVAADHGGGPAGERGEAGRRRPFAALEGQHDRQEPEEGNALGPDVVDRYYGRVSEQMTTDGQLEAFERANGVKIERSWQQRR
jgi:hypothetical protein